MAKYSLSNKALEDLSKIWEYTYEVWSELQAEKYYYMLLDTCQDLADGNLSGKSYPEISNEILGFKAGRHVIFYRKAKVSGIEVARILHERMDLKNRIHE
ncbi:type II toxin-antitoxin system RelE/ParE family toxin [Niastella caeni]|uniref:Toxin n=1 Tax=Niastella caeni TaxID=2569763 RepID=A0A4S8HC47_9BACT|nr:type II toxin-antitoxin system RelE/ParE family toxin [Niastella caeni]THU32548.1 type II toxin-antitoxin system RelE/ParE family toxin [Niastella caeni]